jgi:predicted ATPase/DNA-binding CsgD family transcriptional regulator
MDDVRLTPRERDILLLICDGWSNQAIADRLILSLGTVKWYNKQIFAKLGVDNRTQAALAARKIGVTAPKTVSDAEAHLPVLPTSFIGRAETIAQVGDLLNTHRLVTIVGQGGVGKTRLALEVARQMGEQGQLTPYFVSLAPYSQIEALPLAIADRLKITIRDQQGALQQVIDALLHQPSLVILDNFEHLLEAADFLDDILRTVREVRLLVTSRERLRRYGEMVFVLHGLATPQRDSDADLLNNEAVRLFLDRARLTNASFEPTLTQLQTIAAICRQLVGLPLAIEHAASWMYVIDPATLLKEMQKSLDVLRTSMRGVENRHQSMRAVIDYSWARLSVEEQCVLMRLSVFRGGFRRDAAIEVANASLDILMELLAKSFVARSGPDRYDLHELHRQYALEKLLESGEAAIARERHARFFENLVRRIAPQRWNMDEIQLEALNRLDEDYANLREAVQWSLAEDTGCIALCILGYGAIFFFDRGHAAESVSWIRAALSGCRSNMDADLHTRACFALVLQDPLATDEEHRAYLQWAKRSENLELIAIAYWQCGDHATFKKVYAEAQRYYERALELAAQSDYQNLSSIIMSYMGQLAETRGDLKRATQYYRDAYEHMQAHGVRSATRPRNLARMLLLKGDEAQARELFRIALDNAIHLNSPLWTLETLLVIMRYLQAKHDLSCAVQLLAACLRFSISLNLPTTSLESNAETLRQQIGTIDFDPLWAAGKSLTSADAIGLAQQALEELS